MTGYLHCTALEVALESAMESALRDRSGGTGARTYEWSRSAPRRDGRHRSAPKIRFAHQRWSTNLLLPYNPLLCCFSPLSWAVAGLKILLTPGPATATVDLLVVSRHRQQQSESGNFFQYTVLYGYYTPPSAIISCLLRQIYVQCFVHFENMYNFDICFNIFQKSPNFETFS